MRLGGPIFEPSPDPPTWALAHRQWNYTAAYLPAEANPGNIHDYVRAAAKNDLLIAEVGAWSNPIAPEPAERRKALDHCCRQLDLADRAAACCCVNIAGSRAAQWDGPHPANLTLETFDLIVATVREIMDAVKPTRTTYALETMPWIFPDSPDAYLDLLRAIDRKSFAVHFDPVNMINCPRRAFDTRSFILECFQKLGPHIRSCHAKDIRFTQHLTVHLDECRPGTGVLDYAVYLRELSKLHRDTPLMLEHLPMPQEYQAAGDYIRGLATQLKLSFHPPQLTEVTPRKGEADNP